MMVGESCLLRFLFETELAGAVKRHGAENQVHRSMRKVWKRWCVKDSVREIIKSQRAHSSTYQAKRLVFHRLGLSGAGRNCAAEHDRADTRPAPKERATVRLQQAQRGGAGRHTRLSAERGSANFLGRAPKLWWKSEARARAQRRKEAAFEPCLL